MKLFKRTLGAIADAAWLRQQFTWDLDVMQDIRFGLRMLRKNPGFTLVAVLTLALGIGACTTIFTVVNGILLRPLPYKTPERLGILGIHTAKTDRYYAAMSPQDSRDLHSRVTAFEDIAVGSGGWIADKAGNLTGDGVPEQVDVGAVSVNFFSLLGVEPALGRNFLAEEGLPDGPDIVILSHGLWQRRYGGNRQQVGRTIQLDGRAHTVVGILPENFRLILPSNAMFFTDSQIWVPLQLNYEEWPRNFIPFTVFGRLTPGRSFAQAQAELEAFSGQIRAEHASHANAQTTFQVYSLHDSIVKEVRQGLLLVLGAVAFVLLIACLNVANLLLSRSSAREKEMAVRAALGASWFRIARQVLTESLLLAMLGCAAGILLAKGALSVLFLLQPGNIPLVESIDLDGKVLAFAVALSMLTVAFFGVAPAVRAATSNHAEFLKEGGRSSLGAGSHRFRYGVVVVEMALSLTLLTGAGLLLRSFANVLQVKPGFNPENVLTFRLTLPDSRYPDLHSKARFLRQLQERIAVLPSVENVGATSRLPLTGPGGLTGYEAEEQAQLDLEPETAASRLITPGYFAAMGIPVLAGRPFTFQDTVETPYVVVVDETLAQRIWGKEKAVGKRLKMSVTRSLEPLVSETLWHEVVGVVGHVRNEDLTRKERTQLYRSRLQHRGGEMFFAVRSSVEPSGLLSAIEREAHAFDADLPVSRVRPMKEYVSIALAPRRFGLASLAIFAVASLLLVSVGLYGVISFAVNQRIREFALRLALGAPKTNIFLLVFRSGLTLSLLGILLGTAASLLVSRYLDSLLFGVTTADPVTFAGVAALLLVVALVACYIPARRATKVDPMVALRYE